MSQNLATLDETNLFRMCGNADVCLRQLKSKNIFIIGLSRSGKSTLYNHINNVNLVGVPNEQDFGDVCFQPFLKDAKAAAANNGILSVTLLPNISDKGDYTMSDMGGFMDTRRYVEVVGISYILKAAFQKVKQCQFVLVIKQSDFKNSKQLFVSIKGFIKMFNFKQMSAEEKQRLLQSVTVAVTRSPAENQQKNYSNKMKSFSTQINNPKYGGYADRHDLDFVLSYFAEHSEQFYQFKAAILNKESQHCTIVEDHFQKRSYFNLRRQNQQFQQKHDRDIYNLPFAEDIQRMDDLSDKSVLDKNIQDRIQSYTQLAKILQKFFEKGIKTENFFKENLNFSQEFNQMKSFNQRNDVYSRQLSDQIDAINQKISLHTSISPGDPPKPLKIGIKLAQNVFKLYNLFSGWPEYNHQDHPSKLLKFLEDYKEHLIKIIILFRDSFCCTYEEQQSIKKFLFIASRGCRQFSMLYQIKPDGKHHMCLKLKDSFESILSAKPLKDIQKQFIVQLHKNINKVTEKIKSDISEINQYLKYLNNVVKEEDYDDIKNMQQYKNLIKILLNLRGSSDQSPEDAIISLFENLHQEKKTIQQLIDKMTDDEQSKYPKNQIFQFIHFFNLIGKKLFDIQRADSLIEDKFAYNRGDQFGDLPYQQIKHQLFIEQMDLAKRIFTYCNDVQSVCKTYEIILKHTSDKDYPKQIENLTGMANYCSKNGRVEQAIVLYQKSLSVCQSGNLFKDYQEINQSLGKLYTTKEYLLKTYFAGLKQKTDIDPSEDVQLQILTAELEELYIRPYKVKKEQEEARQQSHQ